MFIFIIKLQYNYNKLVFNFCLNINSMGELYLFQNIILTSFFEICLFNYICVPRSVGLTLYNKIQLTLLYVVLAICLL